MEKNKNMRPFGIRDKFGYAMGDFGNNFTFLFAQMYMMVFCTDVLGLPGAAVGSVLVAARLVDAFTDVGMGRICDTSKPTEEGRFRIWIKRLCLPMGISSMLIYMFWVRDFPMPARIAWVLVTYILWGSFFYTGCNIPYGSMASVISNDSKERSSLSTWRSVGAVVAGMVIGVVAPLVIYGRNEAGQQIVLPEKFTMIAVVFGLCAAFFYFLCYKLTTERVQIKPVDSKEKKTGLFQTLGSMFTCRPLLVVMAVAVALLIGSLLTSTLNSYLYKDYFNDTNIMALGSMVTTVAMLLTAPFATKLGAKFGKKEVCAAGMLFAAVIYFILFFVKIKNPVVFVAFTFVASIGTGIQTMLTWAFMGDVIDYQEIQTGTRNDGTVYAIYSFVRKVAQAAAGGLGGFVISAIGYQSSTTGIEQTAAVKASIYNTVTLVPAVCYLLVFLLFMFGYPLTKKKVEENARFLAEKRSFGQ